MNLVCKIGIKNLRLLRNLLLIWQLFDGNVTCHNILCLMLVPCWFLCTQSLVSNGSIVGCVFQSPLQSLGLSLVLCSSLLELQGLSLNAYWFFGPLTFLSSQNACKCMKINIFLLSAWQGASVGQQKTASPVIAFLVLLFLSLSHFHYLVAWLLLMLVIIQLLIYLPSPLPPPLQHQDFFSAIREDSRWRILYTAVRHWRQEAQER